ncbi:ankyrin repeat-containing domain protein [Lasiosphaeris hirsuta]|uniref:Ankyrin repeat-containing domain protein n=1 Tax=Lasiosphaeris hirsuta TaxID=260670 RepID=A0AA40DFA7_9PEZI|nr:ankyrin repeat-containing domain protein [Lasiosphaeris hirsuta]
MEGEAGRRMLSIFANTACFGDFPDNYTDGRGVTWPSYTMTIPLSAQLLYVLTYSIGPVEVISNGSSQRVKAVPEGTKRAFESVSAWSIDERLYSYYAGNFSGIKLSYDYAILYALRTSLLLDIPATNLYDPTFLQGLIINHYRQVTGCSDLLYILMPLHGRQIVLGLFRVLHDIFHMLQLGPRGRVAPSRLLSCPSIFSRPRPPRRLRVLSKLPRSRYQAPRPPLPLVESLDMAYGTSFLGLVICQSRANLIDIITCGANPAARRRESSHQIVSCQQPRGLHGLIPPPASLGPAPESLYNHYLPLEPGYIRLLRLFPPREGDASMQCKLFEYPLRKLQQGTHLYETLISINSRVQTHVTQNLHDALMHLRDRSLERILWVDTICINQADDTEKGHQVRFMAEIYAHASRVIVWLGKADDGDNSAQALEALAKPPERRRSTGARLPLSKMGISKQYSLCWSGHGSSASGCVLQEVAAARNILVKCGPSEMEGYAFCIGLSALKLPSDTYPDLHGLIPPITYLMRYAPSQSRSRHDLVDGSRPDRPFSLDIRHLGELVDMYHSRKASDPRYKVYALLGMCSDDPISAGFKTLRAGARVDTWDEHSIAVIRGKGCILGEMTSRDNHQDDGEDIDITWKNPQFDTSIPARYRNQDGAHHFIVQASAKHVQKGDVVCLLEAASKPTVIRLCSSTNHAAVVMLALSLADVERLKPDPNSVPAIIRWPDRLQAVTAFPVDFDLVWDWDVPQREMQDRDYEHLVGGGLVATHDLGKGAGQTTTMNESAPLRHLGLDRAIRLWRFGLLLNWAGWYQGAAERLSDAVEIYEKAPNWTPLDWAAEAGDEATARLLIANRNHGRSLSWARSPLDLAIVGGHEAVVRLLLGATPIDHGLRNFLDKPMRQAPKDGYAPFVELLLSEGASAEGQHAWETGPSHIAAEAGHMAVVKLLLDRGATIEGDGSGWFQWKDYTPLRLAAGAGHENVVRLLLDRGVIIDAWDGESDGSPLCRAAKGRHEGTVRLLLERHAALQWDAQPLRLAARAGHHAIVQLLLDKTTSRLERCVRESVLEEAVEGGDVGVVKLLLDRGIADEEGLGQKVLKKAVEEGHEAVVQLLLCRGTPAGTIWDAGHTALSWAIWNQRGAVAILLLNAGADINRRAGDDGRSLLWKTVEWGNEAVVRLLLDRGAAVRDQNGDHSWMLLGHAVKAGHQDVVRLLLGKGLGSEAERDHDGRALLLQAAKVGQETVVRLLLDRGVPMPENGSENSRMLLWQTAEAGHTAVLRLLIDRGMVIKGEFNRLLLWRAIETGYSVVVQLLFDMGASAEEQNGRG